MFKINIPFEITRDFVEDVMHKAISQGSAYWLDNVKIDNPYPNSYKFSTSFANGDPLLITNTHNYKVKTIRLKDFKKGFLTHCEYRIKNKLPLYFESSDIDIMIADEILQCIVFNDIIFG